MRGPWSASSKFWIGGDDPGSGGVYAVYRPAHRYAAALPFRKSRQPASASGGDGICDERCRAPEMTLGNTPGPAAGVAKRRLIEGVA
jgi:hypothetical protein